MKERLTLTILSRSVGRANSTGGMSLESLGAAREPFQRDLRWDAARPKLNMARVRIIQVFDACSITILEKMRETLHPMTEL